MLSSEKELPVGLLGEHRKSIFVCSFTAFKIALTCGSKSLESNTSLFSTLLIFAKTPYIPYVGGKEIILSLFGSQKALNSKSSTSSLPFPSKI